MVGNQAMKLFHYVYTLSLHDGSICSRGPFLELNCQVFFSSDVSEQSWLHYQ